MKRGAIITFVFISISSGAASLIFTNNAVANGYMLKKEEAKFAELNDTRGELEAEYLRGALEHLEPKAKKAGFVAVSQPRYIEPSTVVGFLSQER